MKVSESATPELARDPRLSRGHPQPAEKPLRGGKRRGEAAVSRVCSSRERRTRTCVRPGGGERGGCARRGDPGGPRRCGSATSIGAARGARPVPTSVRPRPGRREPGGRASPPPLGGRTRARSPRGPEKRPVPLPGLRALPSPPLPGTHPYFLSSLSPCWSAVASPSRASARSRGRAAGEGRGEAGALGAGGGSRLSTRAHTHTRTRTHTRAHAHSKLGPRHQLLQSLEEAGGRPRPAPAPAPLRPPLPPRAAAPLRPPLPPRAAASPPARRFGRALRTRRAGRTGQTRRRPRPGLARVPLRSARPGSHLPGRGRSAPEVRLAASGSGSARSSRRSRPGSPESRPPPSRALVARNVPRPRHARRGRAAAGARHGRGAPAAVPVARLLLRGPGARGPAEAERPGAPRRCDRRPRGRCRPGPRAAAARPGVRAHAAALRPVQRRRHGRGGAHPRVLGEGLAAPAPPAPARRQHGAQLPSRSSR